MSVFNVPVLLLTMDFVITLSKRYKELLEVDMQLKFIFFFPYISRSANE